MNYADRRESRRLQSSWLLLGFVIAVGVACVIRLSGTVLLLTLAFLGVILATFLFVLLRRPQPSSLTTVTNGLQEGTWSASIPAFLFPQARNARPRMNEFAEFAGTVWISPAGVTWKPNDRTRRGFGISDMTWEPTWSMSARRLRGIGSQVQLNLRNTRTGETVTMWLRGASAFRIG